MDRDAQLRRMKAIATGLLLAAAAIYVFATILQKDYPWLSYVAATSEAAMVGAVADWFAVVALFHHPLNLRFIPHTAIIPRSKARIAQGLSEFIQQNFLSAAAVVERIAAFQPAHTLCRWLLKPENAQALSGYAVRFLGFVLAAFDDERVKRFLQEGARSALGKVDLSAALGQVLDVLTENRRHHALLDEVLARLDELLSREETRRMIAEEVQKNAPLYLRSINELLGLKLDEKAALKIVEVALQKLSEVRRDGDHELRKRFDAYVVGFIERLKTDEAMRSRVSRLRDEVLASPALADYLGSLWRQARAWLDADIAGARSLVHERIAGLVGGLAARLEADRSVLQWVDAQILAALPHLIEEHRAKFGRFVEDQINGWQEKRLVEELERHIGPDLQYIRVNGTLVGAAVGLAITVLTRMF